LKHPAGEEPSVCLAPEVLQIEGSQEFIFDLTADMPIMAVGFLVQKRSAARRLQALTSILRAHAHGMQDIRQPRRVIGAPSISRE
jgi:hypothetical protein